MRVPASRPRTEVDLVKSADRAMALLELFRAEQRPLSAREISSALGVPRSSVNVLLRTMIRSGYVFYDSTSVRYFPTFKVVSLSNWLLDGHFTDARVDSAMRELHEQTGETISLSAQLGDMARFIRVLDSSLPIALRVRHDATLPLYTSAVGQAILSRRTNEEIRASFQAARGIVLPDGRPLAERELLASVERVRRDGASVAYDRWLPDTGAVAIGIDYGMFHEPMAIAIAGPSFRIRRSEKDLVALIGRVAKRLRASVMNDPAR